MADFINTVDILGDDVVTGGIIDDTLTEYHDDTLALVGAYAFYKCANLTSVKLSSATEVQTRAFDGCSKLVSFDSPSVKVVNQYAFYNCTELTTVKLSSATGLRDRAFDGCSKLESIDAPSATVINTYAFNNCTNLVNVNLPSAISIEGNVFSWCTKLKKLNFPSLTSVGNTAIYKCLELESVDLPSVTSIQGFAFYGCDSLKAVIMRGNTLCSLAGTTAFDYTCHFTGAVEGTYNPTGAKDGYFYVPSALLSQYQSATNWSKFASQFRALEDYTVDGTTTGALDPSKI